MNELVHAEGKNRLGLEKSPYLLQHESNPVWWWAWGDEAFEQAKEEGKLVLLSIGYSTCHWCHVMEHESFEDQEVADLLNEHFISIKVDREERPDVDKVYMDAVTAMTGRGGWPMTVLLTPDRKPFFGGTYFPKENFIKVLTKAHEFWKGDRARVHSIAERLLEHLQEQDSDSLASQNLTDRIYTTVLKGTEQIYDPNYGGFGRAPKFPPSMRSQLLLRVHRRSKESKALDMVVNTLEKMAEGGMYDHLGGGFHRYSTDDKWLVPHFEKMLYDNAVLSRIYLEAYQVTNNEVFLTIAHETLDYVLEQMTGSEGGFYSAEDADSLDDSGKLEEGSFYVWKEAELKKLLTGEEYKRISEIFSISKVGNFEHSTNILAVAGKEGWKKRNGPLFESARKKLFDVRAKRPRPRLDDKILTAWNGLMIDAMAYAYRVTGKPKYLAAAQSAARFLKSNLWKKGKLLRRFRDGEGRFTGVLDDYAYLITGLLSLYEVDPSRDWLDWALELQEAQDKVLWDSEKGGYFYSPDQLIMRTKEFHDNARPNANGLSALNLLKLYDLTLNAKYKEKVIKIFSVAGAALHSKPLGYATMFVALDYLLDRSKEVVIAVGSDEGEQKRGEEMIRALQERFIPNMTLALNLEGADTKVEFPPVLKSKLAINGKTTAYVCEEGVCKLPTSEVKKMLDLVGEVQTYEIG